MKPRRTLRKDAIWKVIGRSAYSKPILLEELRWQSLMIEYQERVEELREISRTLRNSFARTIRDHIKELKIYKYRRPERQFCGLIARAAVYRLYHAKNLNQFLNARSPEVLLRYSTSYYVSENYQSASVVSVSLSPDPKTTLGPINFHVGSPLSIVSRKEPSIEDLLEMANVGWTLRRLSGGNIVQVAFNDPVVKAKRRTSF